MKRIHLSLLVVAALASTTAAAVATTPTQHQLGSAATAISDGELLAAASRIASLPDSRTPAFDDLVLVETAWQTGAGSLQKSAMPVVAKAGETGEGPEAPEGPGNDGPGGSTHEGHGEENGEH
jgi:hypothetical protein